MNELQEGRIGRLKWHCRRALLELDIVFQRFWAKQGDTLDAATADALEKLLALEDHDLWELVNGRADTADPQLKFMVERLRQA